MIAQNRQKSNA